MKRISKKSAALGVVTALVFAVAAYAYLSSTGSGSGSGSASTKAQSVTLTGTTDTLTDIGDTATMTIKARNDGDSPVKVSSISVVSVTPNEGCPAGSFSIADPEANGAEVAEGATATTVGTAVVTFVNDSAKSQDLCTGFTAVLASK